MPPIRAFAAGAILHRAMKEVRRMNAELDRVNTGRAIAPPMPPTSTRDPPSGDQRWVV